MGFKFNGQARLTGMNVRSENHGDEPVTAIDLKFEVEDAQAACLYPVLGIDGDEEQQKAFAAGMWDEDGPRFSGITEIICWAKFEDHHTLRGTLSAEPVHVDKVHKFAFKPWGTGRADIKFTVSIQEPSDSLLTNAADSLKDLITIEVDHEPELDLGQQEEAA
ncbi:MAG: hypothetical protein ACOC8P_00290 [Dichotomicrobium sp.]